MIYHYPVKGFNGQPLTNAILVPGEGLPNDRRYAISNTLPGDYDGSWLSPGNFLVNSATDGLQRYTLDYAENSPEFCIISPDGDSHSFFMDGSKSLDETNQGLGEFFRQLGLTDNQSPRLVEFNRSANSAKAMWDYPDATLSIINMETVRNIGEAISTKINPLRFRGNLMIDDLPAWEEFSLVGKRISIGEAELEIIRPIDRCPATSVNPANGKRDINIPLHLSEAFGHVFCGVYAKVVTGGI